MRAEFRDRHFTGVAMRDIFAHLGVDTSGASNFSMVAHDGFSANFTYEAAMTMGYVVIGENGEPLGMTDRGPAGPFFAVGNGIPNNLWVRNLATIRIN
jgi:hypothetical protein